MRKLYFIFSLLLVSNILFAQKDAVEKIWYNASKTAKIQIYKAVNGKFYGRIVWLQKQNDDKGKPRTDIQNPNKNLRNVPLMHLLILKDFEKSRKELNVYEGGTLYDPNTGKTYCGKITFEGKQLKLNGSICSLSFLSKSSIWTLAE